MIIKIYFLLIFHRNFIGCCWCHSTVRWFIEYPKRIRDTHEYESESDERDHENRPARAEILLRPVEFARPTVDDLAVSQGTQSHRDAQHRIEDFNKNHSTFGVMIEILSRAYSSHHQNSKALHRILLLNIQVLYLYKIIFYRCSSRNRFLKGYLH